MERDAGRRMSSLERAPYEILVELLEQELKLVREGQFEQLDRAVAARIEYTAWLPATPPASAQEPLQRALQLHQQLIAETEGTRESLLAEVSEVQRATRAARGYAPHRQTEHLSASA